MYFEINLCLTYRHGISKSAGLKLLLQLHKVQTMYGTLHFLVQLVYLTSWHIHRYLWVVCTILVPLFKIFLEMSSSVGGCHHKDVLRFKVIQILSLSDDDDAFPKLSRDNENNNTNTKKNVNIFMHTPQKQIGRYFEDGNSKTQKKNLKHL